MTTLSLALLLPALPAASPPPDTVAVLTNVVLPLTAFGRTLSKMELGCGWPAATKILLVQVTV